MISRIALIVCLLAPMASATSPAHAGGKLGLSSDGIHWGSGLTEPLFDPQMRWVPGDSETATFYLRHQADGAAELSIDVISSGSRVLMGAGDLQISASGGGEWTTVSEPGIHRLLASPNMRAGSMTPVQVNVALSSESKNITQFQGLRLSFRITLSEAFPEASTADQQGKTLPHTGAPRVLWIAVVAALLVGTGSAFAMTRRIREDTEHV